MKKPSLTALDFVGHCLPGWRAAPSLGVRFSAKILEEADPKKIIALVSEDLNAALDLFAGIFSDPSDAARTIEKWMDGCTDAEEEFFDRLRCFAWEIEMLLDDVEEKPHATLNLTTAFLRDVDQLRADIAQSLISIAIDQIGNPNTGDDMGRKIDEILSIVKESASIAKETASDVKESAKDSHDSKVAAETLLADKVRATAKRRAAGQAAYQKQLREDVNASERQRAQEDMDKALQRVHDRVENGEQVLSACRAVCSHFKNIGSSKNATWSPLTGRDGNPIQAQTLARYYRKKKNKRNATTA